MSSKSAHQEKNLLYLPSASGYSMVHASGAEHTRFNILKQIFQIEHNRVKNPNWQEADQLTLYKCGGGVELGSSVQPCQNVL